MVESRGQIRNLLSPEELEESRSRDRSRSPGAGLEEVRVVAHGGASSKAELEASWSQISAEVHRFTNTSGFLLRRVVLVDAGLGSLYRWKNEFAAVAQNLLIFVGPGAIITKAMCLSALVSAGVRGNGELELTFVCGGKTEKIWLRTFNEEWAKHWVMHIQEGSEVVNSTGQCLSSFVPMDEVQNGLKQMHDLGSNKFDERAARAASRSDNVRSHMRLSICKIITRWAERRQRDRLRQSFTHLSESLVARGALLSGIKRLGRFGHEMIKGRLRWAMTRMSRSSGSGHRHCEDSRMHASLSNNRSTTSLSGSNTSSIAHDMLKALVVSRVFARLRRKALSTSFLRVKYSSVNLGIANESKSKIPSSLSPVQQKGVIRGLKQGFAISKALQRPLHRTLGESWRHWLCMISHDARQDAKSIAVTLKAVNEDVLDKARCLPVVMGLRSLRSCMVRIQQRHLACAFILMSRAHRITDKRRLKRALEGSCWTVPQMPLVVPNMPVALSVHQEPLSKCDQDLEAQTPKSLHSFYFDAESTVALSDFQEVREF